MRGEVAGGGSKPLKEGVDVTLCYPEPSARTTVGRGAESTVVRDAMALGQVVGARHTPVPAAADGYLFASRRDRTKVRTDLDRTVRALVDRAVVPGVVTLQSVVRATSTARLDGAQLLGPTEDGQVALAQARHGELVAREWTSPLRLPRRGPRRIRARAPSGRAPWAPEWLPPRDARGTRDPR